MKKIREFLQSMRFGMLLLGIIAVLSIFGTMIVQGQPEAAYTARYGQAAPLILFLGLDHIYSAWYYVGAYALLCINLLFCSILRIGKIRTRFTALTAMLGRAKGADGIETQEPEALLLGHGFRKQKDGTFFKNRWGMYGSFVTHLGLLVMLIACACVFQLEKKQDIAIRVGESTELEDGTVLQVDGFSMEENGRLEYISALTARLPDGSVRSGEIRVNQPKWFGRYKVYQQSYEFSGQLDIRVGDGREERVTLEGGETISLDGASGISYMGSFGEYLKTAGGRIVPPGMTDEEGEPVLAYMIAVFENGNQEVRLSEVDAPFTVGGVTYTFRAPRPYPGLRIKTIPAWVLPLLYLSFAILLAGLYLCFFHVPVLAAVRERKLVLASFKDMEDLKQELRDSSRK